MAASAIARLSSANVRALSERLLLFSAAIAGEEAGRRRARLADVRPAQEGWRGRVAAVGAAPGDDRVGDRLAPVDPPLDRLAVLEVAVVSDPLQRGLPLRVEGVFLRRVE